MTAPPRLICLACGARNEPDSNFCDQCSETLQQKSVGFSNVSKDPIDKSLQLPEGGLTLFLVLLFLTLLGMTGVLLWQYSPSFRLFIKYRASTQTMRWVSGANYLDAEALTGQAIPQDPWLLDIKNFDGMHELFFLDSESFESITVVWSDSNPDITVNEINAAWNVHALKLFSDYKNVPVKKRAMGNMTVPDIKLVGDKILVLDAGNVKAQRLEVPLPNGNGSLADGMQVVLKASGKLYRIVAYEAQAGRPFSESSFVSFLNEWQNAKFKWSPLFSSRQKSWAYTKRGEWLGKAIVRSPEAIADLRKAVELDSNNSEAQLHLQSLLNRA